jgi:FAD/FMN-containing dehydrogenase
MSNTAQHQSATPGVSHATLADSFPPLIPLLDAHPALEIHTPSSPHFAALRRVYNTTIAAQPAALVRPATETEAAATVAHCVAQKLPLTVRAGGHDQWGRSLADAGGVVLDMRRLDGVAVSADRATARVGGGVLGGALLERLEAAGLTTPTGFCSDVGYVGWAAGGGYGVLQGRYGLGVDQIVGARVATPDRGVVEAAGDAELLWALRGAGTGGFGAVLEITIKVYPLPRMLGGLVAMPLAEAESIFAGLAEMYRDGMPNAVSADFMVAKMPGVGEAVLFLFTYTLEDDEDFTAARQLLDRVCSLGTVLLNSVEEGECSALSMTIESLQCVADG